jgi:hypothetical protein
MAENAVKTAWWLDTHPSTLGVKEIMEIYEEAYN